MPTLLLHINPGKPNAQKFPLSANSVQLGRSATNALSFPLDARLSRTHLAIERRGNLWVISDLGSKNGTFVNGARITTEQPLRPNDTILAGELLIQVEEVGSGATGRQSVVIVSEDSIEEEDPQARTIITDINQLLRRNSTKFETPGVAQKHMEALVRAGRELAGHRPLDELFSLILDLSLSAVSARRGVLMLQEQGELVPKAAKGDNFRISRAVCDQVIRQRQSLLVKDTQFEKAFLESHSIAAESVKSLIAVPLQTNSDVLGLIYLDTPHVIAPFTDDDLALLTVMANVAAIRLEQARLVLVEQAERLMQRDLDQAGEIQQGLLPTVTPEVEGLDLAGFNKACRTVGGDYYDFFTYPDGRLAAVLGDVAGKGMAAALMMSGVHARSHLLLEEPIAPGEYLTRLNRATAGRCPQNRFITMAAALVNPATGEVQYSSAGHNPAIVIRASGEVQLLKETGLVLGILKMASYQDSFVTLNDGDLLVLYSDGITEATRLDTDEEFGETRLCRVLSANAHLPAVELIDMVLRAQAYFTNNAPAPDDATLVVIRRGQAKPKPPAWTTLTDESPAPPGPS
ncbi:MAG: SpoIIE family protein phosphatase [Bryobacterales bacterium]|jgi:serine phosphatase RsbU (regulator of sigma subunit)|nr:SpoIIE family protein phosphatase [Bryobacterales bacterium]